ncbi:MAG: recombinase family protein [Candidatus Pacebacteria bacterium]|nr:recombinase family protein [Candidatus Paceibacterota bacterium]
MGASTLLNIIMKNCYIYLRVSTDEQAQQGFSIENQKRACAEYAQMRGYHTKQVFIDDGKSARTTERAALQEMLLAISKLGTTNTIEAIIIYKIDRFARNVADFSKLFMDFKSRNIKLISVNEGDLTEGTSLIPNIFASVAQWESEVNSQRTRDALMQKFREGWQPTPPPIGYRSVGGDRERKTCEPDPYEAPIIKQLFEMYATGNYSIFEMQRWLVEQNITSRTGTPLGHSVIDTILNNPFYHGIIRWHGESKKGLHQPIITKELFETCKYVLAKNRDFLMRRRTHQFLLRGFIYCSECGQRYTAEWHKHVKFKKRGGKIGYYHCPKLDRNGCPAPYIDVEELEKQVQETLNSIEFSQEFIDAVSQKARDYLNNSRERAASDLQGCINQKTAFELKRNKLEDALLEGTIERDVFKRKHEEIQSQLNFIQERMQDIENRSRIDMDVLDEVLAFTRNVGKTYTDAPFFLKRHYLRFFFDRLMVKNKQIVEINYPPIIASLQALRVVIISERMLPDEDSDLEP